MTIDDLDRTVADAAASSVEATTLRDARGQGGRPWVRVVVIGGVLLLVAASTSSLPTVLVVVAIVAMIMIHELGHFTVAKLSGMKVTEFFLGFGPKLFSFRRGETEYGVKAIPAGGYVRIIGMNELDEVAPEDEARTYRNASFPARIATSLAGSFMHFVMAFLILWSIFSFVGVSDASKIVVGGLSAFQGGPSPAELAGVRPGDQIVAVDHHSVTSAQMLAQTINSHTGKRVSLSIIRSGHAMNINVTPTDARYVMEAGHHIYTGKSPLGVIGIELSYGTQTYSVIGGLTKTFGGMGSATWQTITALGSHFSPHGISQYISQLAHPSTNPSSSGAQSRFESPVGIVRLASQAVQAGLGSVLTLLFSINIFVGIFNLVPLLPLDGGHVAISVYEWVRSRKGKRYQMDVTKLLPLTYLVFTVLVLLGLTALYLDVTHPLGNPFG